MDLTEILICLEWSKKEAKLSNEKLEQVFESVVAYGYRAWCKIFQQQQSLSRTREGKLCPDELNKTVRLRLTVDASTLLIIFIPVLFKNNAQKGLTN